MFEPFVGNLLVTLAQAESPLGNVPAWSLLYPLGVVLAGLLPFVPALIPGRTGVIAHSTMKEAVRQPVFALLLALALAWLVLNTFLPFFGFGEDLKMFKDTGLMTILVVTLLLAVWTSSNSIANEIEGKTAMTLLSKPITRRQFVFGKYLGIVKAVLLLMVPLCLAFLLLIYYKVGYDARESSATPPEWFGVWNAAFLPFDVYVPTGQRLAEAIQIVPGLVLIFLEICVLAAVSVAISTRMPMVVNVVSCLAIFIVGHLTPMLVETGVLRLEFVSFMARLIATILPMLEVFNIQAAVATGSLVPLEYLGYALLYSVAYIGAAILVAFILFEDRDLA